MSSHKLCGIDEVPISKSASKKLYSMSLSQETQSHTLFSPECDFEMVSKRDHGPVRTEVCLCVHKMRFDTYHILKKGGEVHKKATKGGVE